MLKTLRTVVTITGANGASVVVALAATIAIPNGAPSGRFAYSQIILWCKPICQSMSAGYEDNIG